MKHPATMLTALTLTLAGSAAPAADTPPPLTCSTVALKTQVVPGEWLILRNVLRNPGMSSVHLECGEVWGVGRVRHRAAGGAWQMSFEWPPAGVASADPTFFEFKAGKEVDKLHVVESDLLRIPGSYEVQLLIKYYPWPSFTKPPAGAWAGVVECTPAQVEVVAPTGVDAEAFKALGPFPLSSDRWEILRSYPTSSYAGYVLLGTFGGIDGSPDSILWKRDNTRERIRSGPVYVRRDLKARAAKYDKEAALLLSAVQSFLGAHPDFPLRSRLRLKQAGLLAYFDRYEEARALAKLGLAEEEDRIWKRDGQRLLDLLVKKGYLKPE